MNNAIAKVESRFNMKRRLRPWGVSHFGGMKAAKLYPLAMCRFRPDEGGTVSTNLDVALAPVDGHMRSNAYVDVIQVFVPYQAIEALELDTQEDAGVTEMTRRRLMAGTGIGLEDENVISGAAYVKGRSVAGAKKVSKTVRLAYLAAVNHLRRAAYYDANLLTKTETAIQPAVLTANIIERFNGVMEPERQIDGAIQLTGDLPVEGLGLRSSTKGTSPTGQSMDETENGNQVVTGWRGDSGASGASNSLAQFIIEEDPENPGMPHIVADLSGAGEVTLRDMMQAQKLDGIIRDFAKMIKNDPQHGEEKVARAIYGLNVDYDDNCQVMYRQTFEIRPSHHRPTDGPSINEISAHFALNESFATMVPRSELGGQLVTLVAVKPLETLSDQPDPAQTEAWTLVNRVHDELELDEELLTRADLENDLLSAEEDTPVFWTGHNGIKHNYFAQGANSQQTAAVEMKSSMWTYPIPTSITPDNVNYPDTIDMYPFSNWNGEHAEYTIKQVAAISTPLAKGPNPVEKIQIFADDPTLINEDA